MLGNEGKVNWTHTEINKVIYTVTKDEKNPYWELTFWDVIDFLKTQMNDKYYLVPRRITNNQKANGIKQKRCRQEVNFQKMMFV